MIASNVAMWRSLGYTKRSPVYLYLSYIYNVPQSEFSFVYLFHCVPKIKILWFFALLVVFDSVCKEPHILYRISCRYTEIYPLKQKLTYFLNIFCVCILMLLIRAICVHVNENTNYKFIFLFTRWKDYLCLAQYRIWIYFMDIKVEQLKNLA